MIKKLIIRKSMFILLIITLILSGFFITPNQVNALVIEKMVTKYHLDIGVEQIWGTEDKYGNIIWDDGVGPEGKMTTSKSIPFTKEVYNIKAYPYNASKFNWKDTEHYTSNVGSEPYYKDNYAKYASTTMTVNNPSSSGNVVSFSYNAKMSSASEYNLTQKLNDEGINQVFRLMAGPYSTDPEGDVKKGFPDLYNKLNKGRNGVDPKVHAYMYFTPVIIQYDVKEKVEISDPDPESIIADLDVPKEAKMNETFNVLDACRVGEKTELDYAQVYRTVGNDAKELIATWEGTGVKGQNTGQSISQSFAERCTVIYEIKGVTVNGLTDTATKNVNIIDGREIEAKAILELDKYTYEGWPADAEDWSEFTVDGIRYSAKRAYEEKIASNKFRTEGGTVKKDGYDAIVTYPKRGTYPVNLEVTIKPTGQKLTDTKSIEVRKTPYVIDSLGGFQKQNRKQILTFNVATYPDKPLVDYDITIKDLKSNELISLTKDAPQENGACIKTRTVKSEVKDQYWTTLTVEFLTKYPRYDTTGDTSQKFSYKIKVTDSKGDSDEAYKEFNVIPDKPPVPAINMQTSFLRAEGTNTAHLEAADGSQSDGDQLLRTWSIVNHNPIDNKKIGNFVNATTVNGYENLAFGTNQTIGWNKEGVGKATVKLHVKDIWTEPTLEEYIKPSDYLEGENTAGTEVINIAPVVSIEPLDMLKANIAIMVKASEYQAVQNKMNSLQAALIEKDIDGNVSLVKLVEGSKEGKATISVDNTAGDGANNCDSEMMYLVHGGDSNSLKLVAYNNDSAKEVWSYPTGANGISSIYIDRNREKYVIANQNLNGTKAAIILDRNTGAYLTAINGIYLDGEVFLSNDGKRLYCANDTGIYRLDLKTGQYKCVISDKPIRQPRMYNGKIGFAAKLADSQYYIGSFDMNTEQINKNVAPVCDHSTKPNEMGGGSVDILQWSNDGKILIRRTSYNYNRDYGGDLWLVDTINSTQTHIVSNNHSENVISGGIITDEAGNSRYIVATQMSRSDAYKYYNYAQIYDLQGKLIAGTESGRKRERQNLDRGFYNSKDNTIYIFEFCFYGKAAKYNLTTEKWEQTWGGSIFDSYSGNLKMFDNGFYSFNNGNNDDRHDPYSTMYFNKNTISEDYIAYKSLKRTSTLDNDGENYILFADMNNNNLSITDELIKEIGAKSINVNILDDFSLWAQKLKDLSKEVKYKLFVSGNQTNSATLNKTINLLPNTQYNYSYDMQLLSGSAIDTFTVQRTEDNASDTKYYKEVVYQEDLTVRGSGRNNEAGAGSATFTLEKDGYVSFKMNEDTYCTRKVLIDGKAVISQDYYNNTGSNAKRNSFLACLKAGTHTVSSEVGKDYNSVIKTIEAGYLSKDDNAFIKSNVNLQNGEEKTITGTFKSPKELAFTKSDVMGYYQKLNIYDMLNRGCMTISTNSDYTRADYDANNLTFVTTSGRATVKGYCSIIAPQNTMLIVKSDAGGIIFVKPGQKIELSATTSRNPNHGGPGSVTVFTSFIAVEVPPSFDIANKGFIMGDDILSSGNEVYINDFGTPFIWLDTSTTPATQYNCTIAQEKDKNVIIGFSNANSSNNLNVLISNLRLEMVNTSRNVKGTQLISKFASENSLSSWNIQTKGSGIAEMKQVEPVKKDEDAPLVYKKGQLVSYKIYYSDYEKDPSKSGYWLYAHTPYNDGENPEAAIIYDEDGNIKSICGQAVTPGAISIDEALNIAKSKGLKILDKPIDRFYVDGKYTVYHWEVDDTSRGNVVNGYPTYDKVSNTADLTFYVQGGASAPWITGISTSPAKVIENNYFSINVGIDDAEKDVLNLTTEVYKDRKLIFTHRKKNIYPIDANGNSTTNPAIAVGYPVTNTGALPDKAQAGTYEVVCTVRDQTGAGIGTYKFIVVSEGKITGEVYHTEQWEVNRKKYNLNRFKEEVNRGIPYAEYIKLKEPRTRGTNVFWSGEKFMLNAGVAGNPTKVTCSINGTAYATTMKNSGEKNTAGEFIYLGSIWDKSMIYKWGRKEPIELTFTFTAYYSAATTKKHEVRVIVDDMEDYWKLHRTF